MYHPNVARRLLAQSFLSIFIVGGDRAALIRTFHHGEAWRRLVPPRKPEWVPKRAWERGRGVPPRASKARSSIDISRAVKSWKQVLGRFIDMVLAAADATLELHIELWRIRDEKLEAHDALHKASSLL